MNHLMNGFILFLILMCTMLILLRITKKPSPPTLFCLSSLLFYTTGKIVLIFLQIPLKFFQFSASYWFWTFSTMMVFFAVYKSISLRMMMNLQRRPSTLNEILSNYIQQESYTSRIDVLVQNELIKKTSGGYQLTLKGKRCAMIIGLVQKLFNINQSG